MVAPGWAEHTTGKFRLEYSPPLGFTQKVDFNMACERPPAASRPSPFCKGDKLFSPLQKGESRPARSAAAGGQLGSLFVQSPSSARRGMFPKTQSNRTTQLSIVRFTPFIGL